MIETISKARPGMSVMSVEASVEELYGDSKDEEWKAEEVKRLKAEQGLVEKQLPVINEFDGDIPTDEDYQLGVS